MRSTQAVRCAPWPVQLRWHSGWRSSRAPPLLSVTVAAEWPGCAPPPGARAGRRTVGRGPVRCATQGPDGALTLGVRPARSLPLAVTSGLTCQWPGLRLSPAAVKTRPGSVLGQRKMQGDSTSRRWQCHSYHATGGDAWRWQGPGPRWQAAGLVTVGTVAAAPAVAVAVTGGAGRTVTVAPRLRVRVAP
jgi:hypothetical protein